MTNQLSEPEINFISEQLEIQYLKQKIKRLELEIEIREGKIQTLLTTMKDSLNSLLKIKP